MQPKEWLYHIEKWLKEKEQYLYRHIAPLSFEYLPADCRLSYEEALQGHYVQLEPGTEWGEKWHYGWFKASVRCPLEAAGERVELQLALGGESTIYVNGKLAGAYDLQHHSLTLTREAFGGQCFEVVAEAYAGHDRDLPIYGQSFLTILNEELYQFFIDLNVLLQLRAVLPPSSLRVSELDQAFLKLIAFMNWGLEGEELTKQAIQGRVIMKPLLDCVNGSTVPKLYMMGQSHLDIAWLWPIEETKRKIARTMSNQLSLLDEYPEYRYVQSQPYLFQLAKDLYPELYDRIKRYVAEGRIIPEGGMWVEPDTNIPSGESLIRQFLYGERFFREEFGVTNEMLWLPDVFGYSGNLPQIMKKCGINYFASIKMYQTYDNITDPFPFNTFTWVGIDGSAVPVHLLDYGPFPNPADVKYASFQWEERVQKEGISTRLVQFGYGDGGGGANRDDLEFLRRMANLEGIPQTVISSPIEYFEDLQRRGMPDAHYVGELYYPAHRGTLTSQAKMKRGNRKSEIALREAELWAAAAYLRGRATYPKKLLDEAWRKLLLLQFHDILPGTSITRVHEEAEADFEELLQLAAELGQAAASALTDGSNDGITYFNSLPWVRTALIELPDNYVGARNSEGELLDLQLYGDKKVAKVVIPAMSHLSVMPDEAGEISEGVRATSNSLENECLKMTFNDYGEITSLFDKETNEEWASGLSNQFLLYRDQPSNYDAWEIDRRYADSVIILREPAKMTVSTQGALFAEIQLKRTINESVILQKIRLERGSRRVDFRTKVDWREKHKLLKVGFKVNLHASEMMNEIQFGYVKRPNHHSRPHDADRFEVSQHKWSSIVEGDRVFSLLNDGKYGLNACGKEMNLTLLRSPTWPDDRADEGQHEFTYALHVWNNGFMSSPVIREAYELNCPVLAAAGQAEPAAALLTCDQPNIMIDTIKLNEGDLDDWIARIYEAKGASTRCSVQSGFELASACETDMLEEQPIRTLEIIPGSNTILLSFKPFEVKTIRFRTILH
ncbi:glycoside hydrolase family 38 C-terminal domain-containing protein [Paenibacillus sp. FSL A5-0031]|uniref:alpha-mannosidase n=1 Tax=Paenibacillus sp. FSL A5-0031 TaxID=1920420 RepID=UPI0021169A94|nr:glycoside hydrolase family 38 C-terminal domain-containing protein [Paenibacillus sp. FSL A5-0031]